MLTGDVKDVWKNNFEKENRNMRVYLEMRLHDHIGVVVVLLLLQSNASRQSCCCFYPIIIVVDCQSYYGCSIVMALSTVNRVDDFTVEIVVVIGVTKQHLMVSPVAVTVIYCYGSKY